MSGLLPRPPAGAAPSPAPPNSIRDNFMELASSIHGTLSLCLQGFVGRSGYCDSADIMAAGGLHAELIQFPENVKRATPSVNPSPCEGDFSFSAEWEKSTNLSLVFSFQQLRVAHIKFSLYCNLVGPVSGMGLLFSHVWHM
jgi:hypothetical protein